MRSLLVTPIHNRLRIAFVVHDYNRHGGHSRYVAELARRFRGNHDVHVFTNTMDDLDTEGITFHHVPAWRANALTTVVSFILPATFLVRGRFDIIHAQGLCGLRQNVMTAHICQPSWFEAAERNTGRPGWRKWIFRALIRRADWLAMRPGAAKRFIAPSAAVKRDLQKHYRLNEQIRVIHHGTDIEQFHPRNRLKWRTKIRSELGLTDADCVALYIGDLQKALPAALRGIARAPGVKLVVVSKSSHAQYQPLIISEGVADRVLFVPGTSDIARYYAIADFFLFPTYYDAFGLVVTEAMATGLPVIVSRAAGASELIVHGENGWLTDNGWDADKLGQDIRQLATDTPLRERMGAAARATIESFTWDRVAIETMAVYREVLVARR